MRCEMLFYNDSFSRGVAVRSHALHGVCEITYVVRVASFHVAVWTESVDYVNGDIRVN